jgi:predicted HTH domain antitoxin
VIPDEVLESAHMSEQELQQEIAVMLFERGKLTMGQAHTLAGMPRLQFQYLLASRQIPVHYDVADLQADLGTLHSPRPSEVRQQRDPERVVRVKSLRRRFTRPGGGLASEELHRERQADKVKE